MFATDFSIGTLTGEDILYLSQFGFVICDFNAPSGVEELKAGNEIKFKTVSRSKGNRFSLVDMGYEEALQTTFDICKDPCQFSGSDVVITDTEFLALSRWVLRRQFLQVQFMHDDEYYGRPYYDLRRYYRGAFTGVTKLFVNGELCGLRLTFTTNRPYAYGNTITETLTFSGGDSKNFNETSPLTGIVTPDLTIKCLASGDLTLTNSMLDSVMSIKNCTAGEIITIVGDKLVIVSSITDHKLYEDFNYEFLKLGNVYRSSTNPIISSENRIDVNTITASIACEVTISYHPIIRDAPY